MNGSFCIAGVGASAGGLEAFTEILRNLPPNTGLALVFVLHLDPKHASLLTELLQRNTRMMVNEAADGMVLLPDNIYVIPPNVLLTVAARTLHLTHRPQGGPQMPVDVFFQSLAEEEGRRAIGIVLSGTATDGTLGLQAIKDEGGITFAQDPDLAKFDGMPRSAINAGCVDLVLPLAKIALELARIAKDPGFLPSLGPDSNADPDAERGFAEVFALLRAGHNVDFTFYKDGTIRRRIARRMALREVETVGAYVALLREQPTELQALFQDLLINVTAFFREPETFQLLKTHVFPELLKVRQPDEVFRGWIPGCSSGEDVYSLAITLLEYLEEAGFSLPIQLFGTDLSQSSLERARSGTYPEKIAAVVSPARLGKFFVKVPAGYRITRRLREMCLFARQNLTSDPPFSKLDLLVCRNVLIYLGAPLQAKAMQLFHYAIKPAGFLVLGVSETIGASSDLFAPLDRQHKVYRRISSLAPLNVEFRSYGESETRAMKALPTPPETVSELQKRMDEALLAGHAPPSALLNRELRVLQFRGPIHRFLEHTSGVAPLHVMQIAKGGLGVEIRNLIQEADDDKGLARSKVVALSFDGSGPGEAAVDVRLSVTPIDGNTPADRRFLVVFEESPRAAAQPKGQNPAQKSGKRSKSSDHMEQLEQELAVTRKYLQSLIADQESITQELKSANEEIQSSNEELQSTNEELLTAKEELQSTNEELTTVNEGMQNRNEYLAHTNDDLFNLLCSVNIPIVMLGNDMHIRRFTPQAERILNLLPSDVGRPIEDFRLKINVPNLDKLVRGVLDDLTGTERDVQDLDGRVYSMWIRPYRTLDNKIDGAVLALFDLTDRRQIAEARFRRLFESSRDGIILAEAGTGEVLEVNPFACRVLGNSRAELIGKSLFSLNAFRMAPLFAGSFDLSRENDTVRREVRFLKDDGEWGELEVTGNVFHEGERRIVQLRLREIPKPESKREVAPFIARHFSNDLTTILIHCDRLLRDRPENAVAAGVEKIRAAASRAAALEKQLVAFGRLASERNDTGKTRRLDLNALIAGMEQMITVVLGDRYTVIRRMSPDLLPIEANPAQIERLLLNLVVNARRSMVDSGQIVIETANVEIDAAYFAEHPSVKPGKYAAITLTDSGSRLSSGAISGSGETFRTDDTLLRGLPAALEDIHALGAQVRAFSELGIGSTVRVFFNPAGVESAAPDKDSSREPAGGVETILIADPDDAAREATAMALEDLGYTALQARNGTEAISIALRENAAIDLIVAEISSDGIAGSEIASKVRAGGANARILYITGEPDNVLMPFGVLDHPETLLRKPYSAGQLAVAVRRALSAEVMGLSLVSSE